MKLKNKKTGEIVDKWPDNFVVNSGSQIYNYHSLAELCEEWEDYEAPKENWIIEPINEDYVDNGKYNSPDELERYEELGLIFNTKEEAEKAVEKLKALKRLKDNGFKFGGYTRNHTGTYEVLLKREIPYSHYEGAEKDLRLLFGGEE